jgi:hypothetical protein
VTVEELVAAAGQALAGYPRGTALASREEMDERRVLDVS